MSLVTKSAAGRRRRRRSARTRPASATCSGTRSRARRMSLRDLRTLQDWFIRYQLNAVPGVAEVASVGGHVQQYQIDVDPNRLRALRPAARARSSRAVRDSNLQRRRQRARVERRLVDRARRRPDRSPSTTSKQIVVGASRRRAGLRRAGRRRADRRRLPRRLARQGHEGSRRRRRRRAHRRQHAGRSSTRVKARIAQIEPGLPAGRDASCRSTTGPS